MKYSYSILYLLVFPFAIIAQTPQLKSGKTELIVAEDYDEPHRPQYHFSPATGWMNDPNGMVYYDGEYHLFYQYYPYASVWGPMHWGHAVSKDLLHWQDLPIALYPDSLGMIFSGSAVVDQANSSGFKKGKEQPLVAIYTYHDMAGENLGRIDYQYQAIAYSNDRGRNWEKYKSNPVISNPGIRDFRDPKVFWHEQSEQWVMIFAARDSVLLYHSPNLKDWRPASHFGAGHGSHGGVWECPDLFPLPVDGNSDNIKWVMLVSIGSGGPNGGSATQYFIGDFDGKNFVNNNPKDLTLWLDQGRDNYAGVTWSDIPKSDGRRIFMGWMSNWDYARAIPTHPWRSAMTLPRELTLQTTPQGVRLFSNPVEELKALRRGGLQIDGQIINVKNDYSDFGNLDISNLEMELSFDLGKTTSPHFGVEFVNSRGERIIISYEQASDLFIIDRSNSRFTSFSDAFSGLQIVPRTCSGQQLKMHLFIDRSSVELFADEGCTVVTNTFFPTVEFDRFRIFARDGDAQLTNGKMYTILGIWK